MSSETTTLAGQAQALAWWAWTTLAAIVFGSIVTGAVRFARDKWWRRMRLRWIAGDYDEYVAEGPLGASERETGVTITVQHEYGYRFSAQQRRGGENEWTSSFHYDPKTRRGTGTYAYPEGLKIDWGNQELSFMVDEETVCAIDTNVAVDTRAVLIWRKRRKK